jgi:hypothetical protein
VMLDEIVLLISGSMIESLDGRIFLATYRYIIILLMIRVPESADDVFRYWDVYERIMFYAFSVS